MSRVRVCIVGPGDNVHVRRWTQGLIDRGVAVSLLSTTPVESSPSSVPMYPIPTARANMSPAERLATLLRGWARVPGLIHALKPDLVHLHSLPLPAAVPFLRLVPRLIVSAWGSDVAERDSRKARLYPRLLGRATAITATSQYLARVTASYLDAPRSIHVVPFGVDVSRFTPVHESPAARRIGTIRHLERNYGIDVLLDALPAVLRAVPLDSCVIAGDGSLREQLRARAAASSITTDVQWLGRVAHDSVPNVLRSLSVFVNPSRAESFGVAALEAQACGVPVIASSVGGLPEVVRDGVTGLLVPPDDPESLATAIIDLLRDSKRRAAMSRGARTWVREHYDWEGSVDQMLAVYHGALSQ